MTVKSFATVPGLIKGAAVHGQTYPWTQWFCRRIFWAFVV